MVYNVNWHHLTPREFEVLGFHLINAMGFEEVTYVAGSGDGGADIVAYLPATIPGIRPRSRKWVFQCKNVKRIEKYDIERELANFAAGGLDTWVLLTGCQPTPQLRNWFEQLSKTGRYPFEIEAWWGQELERSLQQHTSDLIKVLPPSIRTAIGIAEQLGYQQHLSLVELCARLRDHVNFQIHQYAGSKYIPSLYVKRAIRNEIMDFTAHESTIARTIHHDAEGALAALDSELAEYYRLLLDASEKDSLKVTRRWCQNNNVSITTLPFFRPRFFMVISDETKAWRDRFAEEVKSTLRYLRGLTSEKFRERQFEYREMATRVDGLLQLYRQARAFQLPKISQRSRLRKLNEGDLFGVLDLNSFNRRVEQLLLFCRQAVYRALQHTLLLIDRAGSGKTNFVCDLVLKIAAEQPVILLFGKQPFSDSHALISSIEQTIKEAIGISDTSVMVRLDELLETEDIFLLVVIDGINENRRIESFDIALAELTEWSSSHRIQLILTCRDIYSEFFQAVNDSPFIHRTVNGQLRVFSEMEYHSVVPLYLQHYRINCTLEGPAKEACSHPLLLRFFCEAYGSSDGKTVRLGIIRDIRLRELFQVYLDRKSESIRKRLSHYDSQSVIRYLLTVAHTMFRENVMYLSIEQIENTTHTRSSNTTDSLYLSILDEDIIIAEHPLRTQTLHQSVGFVYEAFMEYLVARSLLEGSQKRINANNIFKLLDNKKSSWKQVRGVAEYIALSLFESDQQESNAFLTLLAYSDPFWFAPFWNVMAKVFEGRSDEKIFDIIQQNLHKGVRRDYITGCLSTLEERSPNAANTLASVILWSICLPPIFTWSDLAKLRSGATNYECWEWASKLACNSRPLDVYVGEGEMTYGTLVEYIVPYLSREVLEELQPTMRLKASRGLHVRERLIPFLLPLYPEYFPLLLNGLTSHVYGIRKYCAVQLRHSQSFHSELSIIVAELATFEQDLRIRQILEQTYSLLAESRTQP